MQLSNFDDNFNNEISQLVQQYEQAVKTNQSIFFNQDNFESIIAYYESRAELDHAYHAVQKALEVHNYSAMLWLKFAQLTFQIKDCDEALQYLDKAEALDPSEIGIGLLRCEIYTFEGNYDKALELLQALELKADKDDLPEIYLQFCDVYEDKSEYNKAYEYLKKCIIQDTTNEEAFSRINYAADFNALHYDSLAFHQSLIENEPYNFNAWYNLHYSYKALDNLDKAIDALEFALAIDEDEDFIYIELATLYHKTKQYDKALAILSEMSTLFEDDEEMNMLKAHNYFALEKYKMARYHYNRVIRIDPTHSEAYYHLGLTYQQENKWDKAHQSFEKAKELNNDQYDFLLAYANSAIVLEEEDVAMFTVLCAIDLMPIKSDAYILLTKLLYDIDDLDGVYSYLDHAISLQKNNVAIRYAKVAALLLQHKDKEAQIQLQELLAEDATHHTILFDIAPDLENNFIVQECLSNL
ncbi:MAG: tetratricopeptide repeat protein [Chitinophagales bacterium]|nr:tetratricopeptide repeat protein [Chitinophagales bacterium]